MSIIHKVNSESDRDYKDEEEGTEEDRQKWMIFRLVHTVLQEM